MSTTRRGKRRPPVARTVSASVTYRIYAAGAVLTLLFLAICYRAYGLQIGQADKYRDKAERQHLRTVELPAPRGPILDIQGRELAVTADADSVYANPRAITDPAATAAALVNVLGGDVRALASKLATRRRFVWVERHITTEEARILRELDLEGVELTSEPRRFYPGQDLAGPVLGFAGIDGDGLDGLELRMDELLVGQKARFAALRDAAGRVMMSDGVVKAQPGATVTLTIDRAVQHIAERALADAVSEHQARGGSIVVIDVPTGGILAMANQPTYDPNAPAGATRARARNRAVTDAYEIGSVMKVFTAAAALDAGLVTTEELIDVEEGRFQIGRKMIRDSYRDAALTVGGIIKRSSNVGAVKLARRLGADGLYQALRRYRFGERTGIELPGERSGKLRSPKRWGQIGLASMAFGYGMTVTSLQVAAGFATVGAGGAYREPRIIHKVEDAAGGVIYQHEPAETQVMRAQTAAELLPMLASVFDKGRSGGTARSLEVPPFPVGGKTGTARKVDPETRQYSRELYVSSFAGLAPIDAPRIAVVVLVDEPRGEYYYGADVTGAAFVRVVDETLRYLGVPPSGDHAGADEQPAAVASRPPAAQREDDAPRHPPMAISDLAHGDGQGGELGPADLLQEWADLDGAGLAQGDVAAVPDFRGVGLGRALDMAREAGVELDIEGSGRVIAQDPMPGLMERPVTCHLVLSPGYRDPARQKLDALLAEHDADGELGGEVGDQALASDRQ